MKCWLANAQKHRSTQSKRAGKRKNDHHGGTALEIDIDELGTSSNESNGCDQEDHPPERQDKPPEASIPETTRNRSGATQDLQPEEH